MAIPKIQLPRRIVSLIFVTTALLNGQIDLDAVRPFTGLGGPGSRALGMGQAFTGIADDLTALFYNPAGLAHITKREINLGFTYLTATTDVRSPGNTSTATITATRLGNAGVALPLPNSKLTIAIGYNQARAFERQLEQTYPRDAASTIHEVLTEEGRIGYWSLGVGYQVSTQLALGGAFDILAGKNVYTDNNTYYTGATVASSDYLLVEPEYIGVGLSLGILLAPLPPWRIGLLLRSPQWVSVSETSYDSYIGFEEERDYKIRGSYCLRVGSSLTVGPLLLSGDLAWFDYSQIRFESDLVDVIDSIEVPIDISINDTLRTQYANLPGYAAGAEFLLPMINIKLRGGYRYDPPLYRKPFPQVPQHTLNLGLSVVPVPQIKIDTALSLTTWERSLDTNIEEESGAVNITVNFVYRF
ncbi:MAG: OmpP1/FadL family transporter [Candidatus Neomarinimicrobiota bacterium]